MDLTLDALEQALSPITEIGTEELTFKVSGLDVSLCVLTPEQEAAVQQYSNAAMTSENPQPAEVMSYLERFKVAVLSHAIVQIGDMDLRGVSFIETREMLDNGKPVKVGKHKALEGILSKWPGGMRTTVFMRYYDLLERFERRVDDAIEYDPPDLDSEIERVEQHLNRLKESKERKAKETKEGFTKQVQLVAEEARAGAKDKQEHRQKAVEAALGVTPTPDATDVTEGAPAATEPPQARQPITPQSAPPPSPPSPSKAEPGPVNVEPPVQEQSPVPQGPPPPAEDSFVDMSDTESLQVEAARETARLLALRRNAGRAALTENPSALNALHEARQAAQQGLGASEQVGEHEGKPVFKAPPQELARVPQGGQGGPVRIDSPYSKDASRNPRFKAPTKGP